MLTLAQSSGNSHIELANAISEQLALEQLILLLK